LHSIPDALPEQALLYREEVDRFVLVQRLGAISLSDDEWLAIHLVAGWLQLFRNATTEMSSTKKTTLSSVYAIITALQDDIQRHLTNMPLNIPSHLQAGLEAAHAKLAEYFRLTDRSPYYFWSACMCHFPFGFVSH
jgi:hypothetical protein